MNLFKSSVFNSEEEYLEDKEILENSLFMNEHAQAIKLTKLIDYQKLKTVSANETSSDFDSLLIELSSKGYHPMERVVHTFKNGSCVLQIFVPGFERYNLVRLGKDVPVHGNFGVKDGLCPHS